MDNDLIKTVAQDLKYLREEWDQDISDVSLRHSSTVLRNLLIYSHLQKVANYLNEVIYINAPEVIEHKNKLTDPGLAFYQCGGAIYKGAKIDVVAMFSRPLTAEEMRVMTTPSNNANLDHPVKLGKFLAQPSFVIDGVMIDRSTVIKYVANKLGGAHYDSSRDAVKEKQFIRLDQIRERVKLANKDAIYYELLSIGQRVVKSQAVSRIYEIIKVAA